MTLPDPSTWQPLGDRILVRPLAAEELPTKKGSLWLPEGPAQDHGSLLQGVVVACGPDVSSDILPGFRIVGKRWSKHPLPNNMWITTEDAVECVLHV